MRHFSLYLALRYLRPKRTFVSVITVISVLGVTLGVAVLIIVISVMAGFHKKIKEMAMGYEAHIEAFDRWGLSLSMPAGGAPDAPEGKSWRDVMARIKKNPEVVSASPMVRSLALVRGPQEIEPAVMWGLDQKDGERLVEKHKNLLENEKGYPESKLDLNGDTIVLDIRLAARWGVHVGDKVTLYSPSNLKEVADVVDRMDKVSPDEKKKLEGHLKEMTTPTDLTITAVFDPPVFQDGTNRMPLVIVPLHVAKELLNLGDNITSIGIEVKDPYHAGVVKEELMKSGAFPEGWEAYTWVEKHQQLFATVQNELDMMYIVLSFIVVVAAFCVMNTMITVSVQKRREIGIVAALGARVRQIMLVFLYQGMIVGAVGSGVGVGLGCLIVYYRNGIRELVAKYTGHEIFDRTIYGLAEIPAEFNASTIFGICVGAFFLCTLASLAPAFLAARVEPAEAVRD